MVISIQFGSGSQREMRQPIIWQRFWPKTKRHENERNWTERGTRVCSAPLGSANDQFETNYSSIRTLTKENLLLQALYRKIELYTPKFVILQPTYHLSFYRSELLWFYQDGASHIYPDAWEEYLEPIPEVCDMCNPNKHIGDS